MAIALSYASASKPRLIRPGVGIAATLISVASSAFIVWVAFDARIGLESYVGGGWCGTTLASLQYQQQTLPFYCGVPAAAAVIAHITRIVPAVSRVSLAAAIAGWLVFGFVG